MTDTPRCEPPRELRGVDGWHWLDGDRPIVARWYAASDYAGECWRINATQYSGEGAHKRGYRHIAPVTPPAEVDALRLALENMERDMLHEHQDAVDQYARAATLRATVARLVVALEESDAALVDWIADAAHETLTAAIARAKGDGV